MSSNLIPRRDLEFLLHDWLRVEELTERPRFAEHNRETVDSLLDLVRTLGVEKFEPINRSLDLQEPYVGEDGEVVHPEGLRAALAAFDEAGLTAAGFDEELGGMQLPFTVATAARALLQSASVAATSYQMLSEGNASLMVAHASPELVERFAMPVIEGRWYGTMCLSEPHAGSSLGDITTRAEKQDDGSYRLFGTKMWISGGDHSLSENIVHLVLAKAGGAAAGTKGISLFVVPKVMVNDDGSLGERNDVSLVGLNHKMGWRGTTNAMLNFGEGFATPGGRKGAVGYLVGEEGKGLAAMFHMMNGARIGVGMSATALGYAGYRASLQYARERTQGRPVEAKDPTTPMVPLVRHPDVRRMLLAQKAYAEGALALGLYAARLLDEERTAEDEQARKDAHDLLELLTPIVKSWPSQFCVEANSLAIQVLGGSGYTRDFPVEQFFRDNRLNPIHEGTHGIQALDLLGRKVVMGGGRGLHLLGDRIAATISRAQEAGGDAAAYGEQLGAATKRLMETTATLWADKDPATALSNASVYLEAAGHVVIAWIWLEQLLAATGDDAFAQGKQAACRYFYAFELPRTGPQFDLLTSKDRTTLDLDPDVL